VYYFVSIQKWLFFTISASDSNFNAQITQFIPALKILLFLRSGAITAGSLTVDLNGDCVSADFFPDSINDWHNLVYHGGGTIGDPALGDAEGIFEIMVAPEEMEPCATENDA
jgi:hypothetical protein